MTHKAALAAPWGNRIVKTGSLPAGQFLGNEANWRTHPRTQQDVLAGMLGRVGFVAPVIVNLRTDASWGRDRHVETMVDGHLRVELAISRGEETLVPVSYVDLTREEEGAVLASLDPIGALATTDRAKLDALVSEMPDDLRTLTEVLRQDLAVSKVVTFEATAHFTVVVDCLDASQQAALVARLVSEGYTCQAGR